MARATIASPELIEFVTMTRTPLPLVLLLCIACAAKTAPGTAGRGPSADRRSADYPTTQLARSLRSSVEGLKARVKLGIMPLTNMRGEVLELGEYLAENLVTRMGQADGFDIIERSRLDRVLVESELSGANLLRDDAVISVGKLLGADALVIGTFAELGDELEVNCRLVEVASGRILGTAQAHLNRAKYAALLFPVPARAPGGSLAASPAAVTQAGAPAAISWGTTAADYRSQRGLLLRLSCPPSGRARGVWGTGVSTDDSSICTAAVHSGLITFDGGVITVRIDDGQASYTASTAHGVSSRSYGQWSGSFSFVR
jgi:TolB-like protein